MAPKKDFDNLLAEYTEFKIAHSALTARFEELEVRANEYKKMLDERDQEIAKRGEKISEFMNQMAEVQPQLATLETENEKLKQLNGQYEAQVRDLQEERERLRTEKDAIKKEFQGEIARLKQEKQGIEQEVRTAYEEKLKNLRTEPQALREQLGTRIADYNTELANISGILDGLRETITTLEKQTREKDEIINDLKHPIEEFRKLTEEKDQQIAELRQRMDGALETKRKYIEEKESLFKEREDLVNAKLEAEKKLALAETKVKQLSARVRESGDGLLGSSMEIESLKEKIQEKEDQVRALEAQLHGITTGSTGIFYKIDQTVNYIKNLIENARSNVRLVVPDFGDLDTYGILDLMENLGPTINTFVAGNIDAESHGAIVSKLRERNATLVNYSQRDMYAIIVDSANLGIALLEGDSIVGIFTNIEKLVGLLKDSVINPFIKGTKF